VSTRAQSKINRHLQLLCFVRDFTDEHGYPPTYREIARHFGLGLTTVSFHVLSLRKDRLVDYVEGSSRTLHLTQAGLDRLRHRS
jgi:DNA-binding transcriptional ArsR family regulator